MPVREIAGRRMCRRAIGRRNASEASDADDEDDQRSRPAGAERVGDRRRPGGERDGPEEEEAGRQHLADRESDRDERPRRASPRCTIEAR